MSDDNLTGEITYTAVDLLFLSITVTVTMVLIISYTIKDLDHHELELQNLIEGTLQSTLVHQDKITKQYYPGIINLQTFKDTNLSNKIVWDKAGANIKYEILQGGKVVATNYYVSHRLDDQRSYQRAQERMIEGGRFTYLYTEDRPMLRNIILLDNQKYSNAILKVVAAQET